MKQLLALSLLALCTACNDNTNKSETSSGTEISTPSVSVDSAGTRPDSVGAGLGADTTRGRTNDADN